MLKSARKNPWSFAAIKRKIVQVFYDNNSVLGECARINTRRMYYLSIIAILLRIINILLLIFTASGNTEIQQTWSRGILASHCVLLIFMVVLFIITHRLKDRTSPNTAMYVLQYVMVTVIMAAGIVIVAIDQLVTTNITPFLLICIICGAVFLSGRSLH